jgi:hypothetical protein
MPRKFYDGQEVAVYYASRRMSERFFGKVQGYANGLYAVKYLAGSLRARGDYIFHCKVHELYADANPMLEEGKSEMQQMFNSLLSSFTSNNRHYNYYNNDTQLVWLSFALKRVRDNAFNRTFPTFDNVWRNSRVW